MYPSPHDKQRKNRLASAQWIGGGAEQKVGSGGVSVAGLGLFVCILRFGWGREIFWQNLLSHHILIFRFLLLDGKKVQGSA